MVVVDMTPPGQRVMKGRTRKVLHPVGFQVTLAPDGISRVFAVASRADWRLRVSIWNCVEEDGVGLGSYWDAAIQQRRPQAVSNACAMWYGGILTTTKSTLRGVHGPRASRDGGLGVQALISALLGRKDTDKNLFQSKIKTATVLEQFRAAVSSCVVLADLLERATVGQ